jgi:DNA processing protein
MFMDSQPPARETQTGRLSSRTSARAQPYALWVRGSTGPRPAWGESVAIVGARAATGYGRHVAQFAVSLAADGWVIVSGTAYSIDGAAHHGALVASGTTIAVLASGPDVAYPREHRGLLDSIARHGAVVSEWPPGTLAVPYLA